MFNGIEFYQKENLKQHTTFKIGGYAEYFVVPKDLAELESAIDICKKNNIAYFILGNGSNILASDEGYFGAIISMKKFDEISAEKKKSFVEVSVSSGVNLFKLNKFLENNEISGLEWSFGIPGTIGGAVKMNAGAFDSCIFDYIKEITLLKNEKVVKLKKFDYSYRQSPITSYEVILSVKLRLKKGKKESISQNMQDFFEKRKKSQPYSYPSAGSIFKRADGIIPAKIIDEMGLKGLRIGDAMVSTKHAGFIVNLGSATSEEVKKLIEIIKILAKEKGYLFNEEIIYLK